MTFETLQLAPALLKAVQKLGFENPTPIQKEAIPVVLSGRDLMAAAQTGTGKTAGFALPILQRLASEDPARSAKRKTIIPRAIVIAPTRELAAQIDESFRAFGKYLTLSTMVIYGGVSMNPQIQRLQRGVDIIIATPGRLLDLHNQGFVDLSHTNTLVLDEADRMLDMGFIDDIQRIITLMPKKRQNLLFSATFSNEIRDLAHQLLHNPHTIDIAPRNSTVELIKQVAHPVARARKLELLIKLIKEHEWYQVLVFTRTKSGANRVAEVLDGSGIRATALHGGKSQAARTKALKEFKDGRIQALVATDIAARGIDIDQLACVINFELPNISEDYVHRIGRTGRAGAQGIAISLVTVDEAGFMQQIERLIQREIDTVEIEGFTPAATEKAMPIVMGRQVIWGGIGRPPSRKDTAGHVRNERQKLTSARNSVRKSRSSSDSAPPNENRAKRRQAKTPAVLFAGPDYSDDFQEKPRRTSTAKTSSRSKPGNRSSFYATSDEPRSPRASKSPSRDNRSEGRSKNEDSRSPRAGKAPSRGSRDSRPEGRFNNEESRSPRSSKAPSRDSRNSRSDGRSKPGTAPAKRAATNSGAKRRSSTPRQPR